MTIARWIVFGASIDTAHDTPHERYGWFLDDLRPTLEVSLPRPGVNVTPVSEIRIGMANAHSGIRPSIATSPRPKRIELRGALTYPGCSALPVCGRPPRASSGQ